MERRPPDARQPAQRRLPDGSQARALLDEFNRSYSSLLHLLERCYNGSPRLLAVATGLMYGLREQAIQLMALPSGDGTTTVGPSFEYVPPERRRWADDGAKRIVVIPDGPYLVLGDVPLTRKRKVVSAEGDSISWQRHEAIATEPVYALCRCGQSGSKPFCDGSHARVGFDGTERANARPSVERQRIVNGGTDLVVKRDGYLCMHAAFCVGRARKIPAMMADTADSDVRAQVIGMIERCPSGLLPLRADAGRRRRRARPAGGHRGHRGGERHRRPALGHRRHPGPPRRRPAVRDTEPGHALSLRSVRGQAAVRRDAPGHRLSRVSRRTPTRQVRKALRRPLTHSTSPVRC